MINMVKTAQILCQYGLITLQSFVRSSKLLQIVETFVKIGQIYCWQVLLFFLTIYWEVVYWIFYGFIKALSLCNLITSHLSLMKSSFRLKIVKNCQMLLCNTMSNILMKIFYIGENYVKYWIES